MAKVVTSVPPIDEAISPYDRFLDGQLWECIGGVDFDSGETQKFRTKLTRRCKIQGKSLQFNVRGDKVYVKASPKKQKE